MGALSPYVATHVKWVSSKTYIRKRGERNIYIFYIKRGNI